MGSESPTNFKIPFKKVKLRLDLKRESYKHGTLERKFSSFTIDKVTQLVRGRGGTGTCAFEFKPEAFSTIHAVQDTVLPLEG